MKYNVHHYLPIIVTVKDVEAENMEQAIETSMTAAMRFAEDHLSTEARGCDGVQQTQYADGHLGALVDEVGDENYENTAFFGSEEAATFLPDDEPGVAA